ncbi:DDT domain-containing protein DDR4 isoform X1 [Cucumis melo var. makuwa]|uniref:DDT domain-containing protein DDR4 isoform X1 n=2 Tax=Cucumis melo TaxID=3656 RepID=A0A5D3BH66_CUCMM|nr:DDT domain-containing protein DDR4 isoform X1 [Cucumis melo]KAA0057915.1 DDT domain-containing protein DDR4 isoform X1 [Cucumis melo var. makuwa]TYJ98603.1 DDT domain-containing protein DDR4 isoform X1 [Cucumis melo var. makuwa]
MSQDSSSSSPPPIPCDRSSPEPLSHIENPNPNTANDDLIAENEPTTTTTTTNSEQPTTRRNRPSRSCTIRAAERLLAAQSVVERKPKPKKEQQEEESPQQQQCSKIVTPLVEEPSPSQLPRWSLRSKWELASVLNFLHVFRPLLNIHNEFTVEEFETALITPNDTLSDIHIPLLKAIPPITRMALTRGTWVTVLCRKLRDWWHWVAEGDLPIVASHGVEIEVYKTLDPGMRVVILKALCDIRVEQEDIRSYIENSLKHGVQLSAFRKERIGGDSHGTYFWYEDDPIIGHRLYREIRKVELKKAKAKGSQVLPSTTYQWETVATNFDEFQDVSEKLFTSKNRTEASLGKKLKVDMLPEIEKVHKRKERLLKKQHRQALLLDSFALVDGLGPGRSLRDRKPVTYTFDDYDRSINEAIKTTKRKPPSPEPNHRRETAIKLEPSANGKWSGPSYPPQNSNFSALSPKSPDYDDADEDDQLSEQLDRSNRRRQRPQRYSEKDYVEALSDNDGDFDSDDDIVGEAVYDEEYLRKRKQRRKTSSSSEGDEEYHYEEENDEEEEEEEEESLSISEDSDQPRKVKKLPGRTRRETKLRSVGEIQSGLRRSKRATRSRINYGQYDLSESEPENNKVKKTNAASDEHTDDASENGDYSVESQGSDNEDDEEDDDQEMKVDQPDEVYAENVEEQNPPEKSVSPDQDETDGTKKTRFLDLNELAPGSGFDDAPTSELKDDTDDF